MIFVSDDLITQPRKPSATGAFLMPDDVPFGLSDDEMNEYRRAFDNMMGLPFGIHFEHTRGEAITPEQFVPIRNVGLAIGSDGRLTYGAQQKERMALRYLWERINKGREYVCLRFMARELGLSYDDCDRLVAEAHVAKKIPRIAIVEELEG